MAKKGPAKAEEITVTIIDLLRSLSNENAKPNSYANYARFTVTSYEMILDFYVALPMPNMKSAELEHISRISLPLSVGKGLATAMVQTIMREEKKRDIVYPNSREIEPDDLIDLWGERRHEDDQNGETNEE